MDRRLGTAAWADTDTIENRYAYQDGDIWLGRSMGNRQSALGYKDDRHVCLVSGSRGGKGTTSIVNTLLLWPGSVVVIDPKGENATVTAARRGRGTEFLPGLGQAVYVLDPFNTSQVDDTLRCRYNPLDALNPESDECIDDAARLADALVIVRENSSDPFWDESARDLVMCLILHILTANEYEGRRNLLTLRELITRGDWQGERDWPTPPPQPPGSDKRQGKPTAQAILWSDVTLNTAFDGQVAGKGQRIWDLLTKSPKMFESFLQVADRNTAFLDSPGMRKCLSASDFTLSDIKAAEGGVSLYLCLPQRFMNTHHRWLRMMIALTINQVEIVRGRPATGHQILMLLDEFAGLKRMTVIENAVAAIAGYGLKLFFVLQSLEQLKAVYTENWETFLANSGLKMFFNIEDHFSREYVSKMIGETEIIRDVRSENQSEGTSEGEQKSRSNSSTKSSGGGASDTRGTSEGQNWSSGDSTSKGTGNTSGWSTTSPMFREQGFFDFLIKDKERLNSSHTASKGDSWSDTSTTSKNQGGSRGTSESNTSSTSYSDADTSGETFGSSSQKSLTSTRGMSQTVHHRALISPDEIGMAFASLANSNTQIISGLGLILISGQSPIAVRRVNYYMDVFFLGLYTQHPDHIPLHFALRYNISRISLTRMHQVHPGAVCQALMASGQICDDGDAVARLVHGVETEIYSRPPLSLLVRSGVDGGSSLPPSQKAFPGTTIVNLTTPVTGKCLYDGDNVDVLFYNNRLETSLNFLPLEVEPYCREQEALRREAENYRLFEPIRARLRADALARQPLELPPVAPTVTPPHVGEVVKRPQHWRRNAAIGIVALITFILVLLYLWHPAAGH